MPSTGVNFPVHVVAGVIRDPASPAKIFFTRRKKGQHLENMWEFPGGKVETGENRFQALKRELDEEAGIQVISAKPLQTVMHQYKEKSVYLDVWEVDRYHGNAHGREGQEYRWLSVEDLHLYSFPEADLPVLKALSLPAGLLITPEFPARQIDEYCTHFETLMNRQRYPLVQFRSHKLSDRHYLNLAKELKAICELHQAELILNRPELQSYRSRGYDTFQRRHLNSSMLNSLKMNPFESSVICSASCHDQGELAKAASFDCEFALLSAVKQTSSHPARAGIGWYGFRQLALNAKIPVYALGGVQQKDLVTARYQAAIGVAGITDFWRMEQRSMKHD